VRCVRAALEMQEALEKSMPRRRTVAHAAADRINSGRAWRRLRSPKRRDYSVWRRRDLASAWRVAFRSRLDRDREAPSRR